MPEHRLQPLLAPRSIAVVGVSPKPETFGWSNYRALLDGGFEGDIHLVNPTYDKIDGRVCVASLRDLENVEHAILNVSNARLEAVLDDAIAAGIRAVTIFASGYLQGDRDPPLLERLRSKTKKAGLLVCGGNGTGFRNRDHNVQCSLLHHPEETFGAITVIAQSGSVYGSLLETGGRLAFNLSVSTGQEIATTTADYLDYAVELPTTRAVALFIETIRDPRGFMHAARKARERDIRIVALKSARTIASARMALSHSGALAGDDNVYSAVFEHLGVTRVRDFDEMLATLQIATQPRPMVAGGIVAITDSGGEREHLTDLAEEEGVRFARICDATTEILASRLDYGLDPVNPLDAWGTGADYERIFADCFQALVADDDAAMGIWVADFRDGDDKSANIRRPFEHAARRTAEATGKPVVFVNTVPGGVVHECAKRLREAGTPFIDGFGPLLKAVSHATVWRDRSEGDCQTLPEPPADAVVASWKRRLTSNEPPGEVEALQLLRDFGVASVDAVNVEDEVAAIEAAERLGFPVALKTARPGIAHKSDVGGVVLGLQTAEAVGTAYAELSSRLGARCLIARMAPRGVELVFGLIRDPQFGPVVMVGAGGIHIEVMRDICHAVAPFGATEARRLIDRLRIRPLLDGVRGQPAADVEAIAESLSRFSVLATTLSGHLSALDVNPIIAGPHGALAVDALIFN